MADMELDMVAEKEEDKVANMVAGNGCWLIGLKLCQPEACPTFVSSKLCEFITLLFVWVVTVQWWCHFRMFSQRVIYDN